ncbi:MAG: SulP family inorganic anion transporter [bacterium]|nr:SulP family inorganic anion transporter [bacterium]
MFKEYKINYLGHDIFAGIIVAAISVPISMGYTLVAGLPPVYGLYGSVLPIFIFAFLTSSPQMIFGIDAAPAAMVGGLMATLGVTQGSEKAMECIPLLTLFTAAWLFLFYFLRAGKFVNFISTPVMGGFISGISISIILMQIPKLLGGTAGNGEVIELVKHLIHTCGHIHILSLVLGVTTLVLIFVGKRYIPKFPMAIVAMIVSAILSRLFHLSSYGVIMLAKVEPGLPALHEIKFGALGFKEVLGLSFTIAVVIMAETLLSSNNFANKNGYKLNQNRELLAYAIGNVVSALTGCAPVSGSVSRTVMAEQFESKTQMTSIVAAITMVAILLFGTGVIGYLPVPVLVAIIICALCSVVEGDLAIKLWKVNRTEFFIFMAALIGVLFFGSLYGVLIGGVLSFIAVIIRAVDPPRTFVGVIQGKEGFYNLSRNKRAKPIKNVVIYRFGGNLFFANINTFQEDIEHAIMEDTKAVIVDASGIGNIDITAAERLELLYFNLKKKGIRFYITGHIGVVNDQMRTLGIGHLVEEGAVRRTIALALRGAGYKKPYPLEEATKKCDVNEENEENYVLQEFEWAFGKDANKEMEKITLEYLRQLRAHKKQAVTDIKEGIFASGWGKVSLYDEDELLERLEMHLSTIAESTGCDEVEIEAMIEERRQYNQREMNKQSEDALINLKHHRHELAMQLKQLNPDAFKHWIDKRNEHLKRLEGSNPLLLKKWKEWYDAEI